MAELFETEEEQERAILVGLDLGEYDIDISFDELEELANTAGVETVARVSQKREKPDKASFIGTGKLQEIKEVCTQNDVNLLIFDDELSATQIRNIEEETDIRTIDRTMLILDIFAHHAVTHEGRLQVGLARQKYMLPRLRGMGITLSRLGGGGGGGAGARRGAGETKLETDRRHIEARIVALEKELTELEKRRENIRKRRRKNGVQTVAIVGYTNVGKSTLINALTGAKVLTENKLFATLDPTARQLLLPDGRHVILIDTVGLVRRLPHHLVRAFHSTLEVAKDADLILNVCDASSPEASEQIDVTHALLRDLEAPEIPVLTVYNKWDLVEDAEKREGTNVVCISAAQGEGLSELLEKVAKLLPATHQRMQLLIPYDKGGLLAKIRDAGKVFSEEFVAEGTQIDANIDISMVKTVLPYEA